MGEYSKVSQHKNIDTFLGHVLIGSLFSIKRVATIFSLAARLLGERSLESSPHHLALTTPIGSEEVVSSLHSLGTVFGTELVSSHYSSQNFL